MWYTYEYTRITTLLTLQTNSRFEISKHSNSFEMNRLALRRTVCFCNPTHIFTRHPSHCFHFQFVRPYHRRRLQILIRYVRLPLVSAAESPTCLQPSWRIRKTCCVRPRVLPDAIECCTRTYVDCQRRRSRSVTAWRRFCYSRDWSGRRIAWTCDPKYGFLRSPLRCLDQPFRNCSQSYTCYDLLFYR